MKDIGYYAGFLSSVDQNEITTASKWQLLYLMSDIGNALYFRAGELSEDEPISTDWENRSDRDKLALIRGLCDRIELKLMEAAQ